MIESPYLIPPFGSIDKPFHVLGLETIHNEAASDPLNPKFNNTNQQGGTSKFLWNIVGGATVRRTYSDYGLSVIHPTAAATSSNILVPNNAIIPNSLHPPSSDLMISADFECNSIRNPAQTVYETFRVGLYNTPAANCYFAIRWGVAGSLWPGLRVSMNIVGAGVVVNQFVTWQFIIPATHPVYSSFNLNIRKCNASIIWSKRLFDSGVTVSSCHLFINGYYITSALAANCRDLSVWPGNSGLSASIVISIGAVVNTAISTIRNLRARPVLLYGNGSVQFPYTASWELSELNGPAFDTNSIYNSPQNFRYTGSQIYTKDDMAVRIRNIGRAGFYPLTATMPISGNLKSVNFEHLMINRAQNNPFIKKPPIMMVDHSLDIGDNYIETGAVYEASGRESFPKSVNENNYETSRSQPPAVLGFDHETIWNGMLNGLGDNGKANTTGVWTAIGVNNYKEGGAKLLSESSYAGAVCEFTGLGDSSSLTGNQGWPVQCNRSPSDPLEFYSDGIPPACPIIMENNLKNFRFVGLNNNGTDRHKALFIAIRPTAIAGISPTIALTADLAVGRILNNDMVDISAPFGATGFRIPFGGECTGFLMCDLPQRLGITAPAFGEYSDIALVPLGDPRTTLKHRAYFLQGAVAGNYSYSIKYIDFDSNGQTNGAVGTVNLNMNIINSNASTRIYNNPLQFDIIQPEAGKFVMVATLGLIQVPGSVAPTMESITICVIYSSIDGINFVNPIQIISGAFNNNQTPNAKNASRGYMCTFGFPHLSYTDYGKNSGEILLGLTNIRADSATPVEHLSAFVFKTSVNKIASWNSRSVGSPLTVLVNCRRLISEQITGVAANWQNQYIMGVAAFRDRQGKIHIAMNKKPKTSTPATDDVNGAIYYAVIDDSNYSYQMNVSNTRSGTEGDNFNYYDVVSMSRLTWDNKSIDIAAVSYNGYATILRPYFSPISNDCYFTYNVSKHTTYLLGGALLANAARDPVFRLFQPTTLGELYPPSTSWNYAMHWPCSYSSPVPAGPPSPFLWDLQPVAGNNPDLTAFGLRFGSGVAPATDRNKRFVFNLNGPLSNWEIRLPRETIAMKFRFRYVGTAVGLPATPPATGLFVVKFDSINICVDPTIPAQYLYLPAWYVAFNTNTVVMSSNLAAAPAWSLTNANLKFTSFRDIFVIGKLQHSNGGARMYFNIYAEMIPNIVAAANDIPMKERWHPKTWIQLNDTPIASPALLSSAVILFEKYTFGGTDITVTGNLWANNNAECKWWQLYLPMFKVPGNKILQSEAGALATKVDGTTNNTNCLVGGPTKSLALREKKYSFSQSSLCEAVFQVGERPNMMNRSGGRAGMSGQDRGGYYNDVSNSNTFSPVNWSVGNNTVFVVPSPENIEFSPDRFTFPYKFKAGINFAKDLQPYTFWSCLDNAAPVRICFDSMQLINKRQTFRANCLWLLNTNLINARVKANTVPSAWGAAPFEQAINMAIDTGIVVNRYGSVATEDYLMVEDTTKNWIPNQFVEADSPYYIINNSIINTGGKIVKNTKTKIWFKPSTTFAGTSFNQLNVNEVFRIIAPSRIVKFTTIQDYRYWALEIMPNGAGDIQSYCDGASRIGEFGLGECITLTDHADVGFTETYKNITKLANQNDGYDRLEMPIGRLYKEFNLQYTNCSKEDARNIMDIFKNCKTRAIPTWFALTEHNPSDVMLCDFIDATIDAEQVADFDNNVYYTITLKLRQRI